MEPIEVGEICFCKEDVGADGVLTRKSALGAILRTFPELEIRYVHFRYDLTFIGTTNPDGTHGLILSFLVVPLEGLKVSKEFP